MKITTFLFVVAWLLSTVAVAQTSASASAGSIPPTPPTAGQRQAAEALLNTIYTEDSFNKLIDDMVTSQAKLHPELQRFQPEMLAFMRKYMSWSVLKPEMVAMYAQEFTEPELLEITRFYQSPTGRKAATKLPVMMQNGMAIGQRHVQEHLPELEKIFKGKQTKAEHEHEHETH